MHAGVLARRERDLGAADLSVTLLRSQRAVDFLPALDQPHTRGELHKTHIITQMQFLFSEIYIFMFFFNTVFFSFLHFISTYAYFTKKGITSV